MGTSDAAPVASGTFRKVLLDSPTTTPALGFDRIGRAFAAIITESQPQFAVGIFGGWGSGKTTLMKAIKFALPADTVVCVDFNAWRFEREPQLLVPLLDTIRAALVRWAEPKSQRRREKVRSIATRVGRVVRALATGLSAEVGLPGAAKVSYDVGIALDALSPPGEPETPQSLYVAAFLELERAFNELSASGVARIVVFVDDLDRCLPSNALDVLESMKLFFDLPGFVFVVGLDEDVVERAIRAKFASLDDRTEVSDISTLESTATPVSQRLGREYVKKIFQLPYSLPTMICVSLLVLPGSTVRAAVAALLSCRGPGAAIKPASLRRRSTQLRQNAETLAHAAGLSFGEALPSSRSLQRSAMRSVGAVGRGRCGRRGRGARLGGA